MKKILVSMVGLASLIATPVFAQSYYYPTTTYGQGNCISVAAGLAPGARGVQVTQLQTFLVSQNYAGGGSWMITGYYGTATAAAVRTFQSQNGLPQTGYVDSNTASAINRVACGGATYPNYPSYPTTPSYPTYPYPSYPQYPYPCANTYNYNTYPFNYYGSNSCGNLSISSLSDTRGEVGDRITIYGSGFSSSGNTVRFGVGIAASNVSSSNNGTRLSFTVPSRLTVYGYSNEWIYETTYPVSVVNNVGQVSNSVSFRVTDADDNNHNDDDIEIERVSGPSTLDEGERGTWTLYLEDDSNEYITYTVDWDDNNYNNSYTQYLYGKSASFSHTYEDEGTYEIRFTVRNQSGDSDSIEKTVRVDNDNDNNDTEEVSIDDMRFSPSVIYINRGDTVEWSNNDNEDHTVTSDWGAFDSGRMDPDEEYRRTFNSVGTYTYHCSFHPGMRGTVVVQ